MNDNAAARSTWMGVDPFAVLLDFYLPDCYTICDGCGAKVTGCKPTNRRYSCPDCQNKEAQGD